MLIVVMMMMMNMMVKMMDVEIYRLDGGGGWMFICFVSCSSLFDRRRDK